MEAPAKSTVAKMLGGLPGSCWRAIEAAEEPDSDVTIYIRSLAEGMLAVDILLVMLINKRLLTDKTARTDIMAATPSDAVLAIELNNGSRIKLAVETRAAHPQPKDRP